MEKSGKSIIIEKVLKALGNKKRFLNLDNAKKYLVKCEKTNGKPYKVPTLYKNLAVKKQIDDFDYYKIVGDDKIIFYIHGGAFVARPLIFHWEFLKKIYEMTNATIYAPIYPLAPQYNYKDTYKFLLKLYKRILKKHSSEKIVIMGDSAGATLSLGLTHMLARKKLPLPRYVIPMSPSLDVTFSNPEIDKVEPIDPMLSKIGCAYVCGKWASPASPKNPLVSPKYINLTNFPPIHIFAGTNEILQPDIKKFVEKLKKTNIKISYTEKKGMNHVYPLFPISEAEDAKQKIAEIILEKKLPKIVHLY